MVEYIMGGVLFVLFCILVVVAIKRSVTEYHEIVEFREELLNSISKISLTLEELHK